MFPTIYWLNGNLIKFSHRSWIHFCQQCNGKSHTNKPISKPPKPPFPLGDVDLIWHAHPSADPTHHPKRHLDRFTQFRTTVPQSAHWLQRNAPHSSQNCPFPFDNLHPYLTHPSLDWPHLPPQTAFRSNQPFFHSSPTGQTDRLTNRLTQTDRWVRRQAYYNIHLCYVVLWRCG